MIEETENAKKTDYAKEKTKQNEQTQTKDASKTDTKINSETSEKAETTKTSKQEETTKTTEMVFESEPGEVIDINSMNLDFVEDPSNTYITVDGKRYRVSDILEARKNNKNTKGKSKIQNAEKARRNNVGNKVAQKNNEVNDVQMAKKSSNEFVQKVTDKVNKAIDTLTNGKLFKMDKRNSISREAAESRIEDLIAACDQNTEYLRNIVKESLLRQGHTDIATINNITAEVLKGKIGFVTRANGLRDMASKIYSGADILLMPSRQEPCGLSQMIACRYGTIPVVRRTGGLADSIKAYNEDRTEGNGFAFTNYNAHEMLYVIKDAIFTFAKKDEWNKIVKYAINSDFGWEKSSEKYTELFDSLN